MRRDYYAVLGIASTADLRQVRQAYRRLARQYSPDVNFWDAEARALFEEISEAYRVLSDPGARSLYDRFGTALTNPRATPEARRGDDLHVAIEIGLDTAAAGGQLTLDVARYSPCHACGAEGCPSCGGRGLRKTRDGTTVTIPAGVDTGTQVRVVGEGHAGPHGGARGDLIVSTRVREHEFFVRKGDNLHCELPITLGEAILGASIDVPTLTSGSASFTVPPGTQSGQAFRLRGHGIPHLFGEGRGDLYVTVHLEVPTVDAETEPLVRALDRALGTSPRRALLDHARGMSGANVSASGYATRRRPTVAEPRESI